MSPYRALAEAFIERYLVSQRGRCLDLGTCGARGVQVWPWQDWTTLDVKDGADVRGDGRALPFADGAFDLVKATDVLYFFARPEDALRECARVLVRGGLLLATVPYLAGKIEPGDMGRFSGPCWDAMLVDAGFSDRRRVQSLGGPLVASLNALAGWYGWRGLGRLARVASKMDRRAAEWFPVGYGIAAWR